MRGLTEGFLASCWISHGFLFGSSVPPLSSVLSAPLPNCLPSPCSSSCCWARLVGKNHTLVQGSPSSTGLCVLLNPQWTQSDHRPSGKPRETSRTSQSRVRLKCYGRLMIRNPEESFFSPQQFSCPSLSKPGNAVEFGQGSSKENKT